MLLAQYQIAKYAKITFIVWLATSDHYSPIITLNANLFARYKTATIVSQLPFAVYVKKDITHH